MNDAERQKKTQAALTASKTIPHAANNSSALSLTCVYVLLFAAAGDDKWIETIEASRQTHTHTHVHSAKKARGQRSLAGQAATCKFGNQAKENPPRI